MQLDQYTLEIVIMIVNLLSFFVMITLWRINTAEKGPEVWALAAAFAAAAFFSMIFFPYIGNYAIFLNNAGTLITYLLLLEGILRFRGFGQASKRKIYLMFIIVIFIVVSYINRDFPTARYLFYDVSASTILALSAFFMLYRTRGRETSAHSIAAAAFILLATGFAYRWYLAYNGEIETALTGSTQHPFQATLFLIGIPWTLGWTYGLGVALIFRARQQLLEIADRDDLTGLDNRRSFEQIMKRLLKESHPRGRKFIIFLFDINGFKAINDIHGHAFGDEILISVAESIWASIREDDFAIRFGGDEFVVLMRYQSGIDMELMSNRLRDSIERERQIGGRKIQLRVSIGTAVFPDDGLSMDELLLVADRNMYKEKQERQLRSDVVSA